jgi:hypothetical protein
MTETPTPTLDELAGTVAQLQRERELKERGLDGLPTRRDYIQSIANRQAETFLIGRERAARGFDARQKAEKQLANRLLRANDELAKIDRERNARLEQHASTRRDLLASFEALEARPREALATLRAEIEQAVAEAEAQPVQIDTPEPKLGIDMSDVERPGGKFARQLGRMPDKGKALTGTGNWGGR